VDIDMRGILVRGTRTVKYFGSECDGHHRSHISALRRVTPRFDAGGILEVNVAVTARDKSSASFISGLEHGLAGAIGVAST